MIAWFFADYLFLLPIVHREARYGIFLAFPIVTLAMSPVVRLARGRVASAAPLIIGTLAFAATLATDASPRVAGYNAIAAFVLAHAEEGSGVLFHGFRSQNLVFALRVDGSFPKAYVLR